MIVGQGPIPLAVGARGGVSTIFSLVYLFSFLSSSLWETALYRLKYSHKGPLNPKITNPPITAHLASQDFLSVTEIINSNTKTRESVLLLLLLFFCSFFYLFFYFILFLYLFYFIFFVPYD